MMVSPGASKAKAIRNYNPDLDEPRELADNAKLYFLGTARQLRSKIFCKEAECQ